MLNRIDANYKVFLARAKKRRLRAKELDAQGLTKSQIAKRLKISRQRVYQLLEDKR